MTDKRKQKIRGQQIAIKKRLLKNQNYPHCEYCGIDNKKILQIHHIKPICEGGDNEEDNLIILCPNCHKSVHSGLISRYSLIQAKKSKKFLVKPEQIQKKLEDLKQKQTKLLTSIIEGSRYNMKLMEHIYLGLTDHISYVMKRIKKGIDIQNFYTDNLKIFNPDEFEIGVYGCKIIEERTGIKFPIDEASNIALHFINAQQDNPNSIKNQKINSILKGILDIVKYTFNITFDEESTSYIRFISHLKRFAQRIISYSQDSEMNDIIFDNIFETCYREYYCVKKIGIFIKKRYRVEVLKHEELYLTLHIHRILEEDNKVKLRKK